jgi:hypothetical protein
MPVIPATREIVVWRINISSQPQQKARAFLKNNQRKKV